MSRPCLVAVSLWLAVQPCTAQVITDYQQDNVITDQSTPVSAKNVAQEPDTTGLWYHIRQQQQRLAVREFERLVDMHPGWQPSQDITTALAILKSPPEKQRSEAGTGQASMQTKRTMFEQLAAMPAQERINVDDVMLRQINEEASVSDDAEAHDLLGWTYLAREQFNLALSQFEAALHLTAGVKSREGITLAVMGLVSQALSQFDVEKIKALRHRYPALAINKKINRQAWQLFNHGNYPQALTLFQLSGYIEGQVFSLERSGQSLQAAKLACQHTSNSTLLTTCANYWASQQATLFERGAYKPSLAPAEQLAQIRALTASEQALVGWAAYEAGDAEQARHAFTHLLEDEPDNHDFAQALLNVTAPAQVPALANRFSLIEHLVKKQRSNEAWARKQFILAGQYDAGPVTTPAHHGGTVYSGLRARQRSGRPGLGNFGVLQGNIGFGDTLNQWRWDVRLDYEQLYSGAPEAGSWFGDGPSGPLFNGISGFEDTGLHASVQHEMPNLTVYGELNYALFSQPVPARVTGQLSATWFLAEAVTAVNLYRLRVEDSLLSMGSTYTESSDNGFGGVHKTGAKWLYSQQVQPDYAVSVSAVWDEYEGKYSRPNTHNGLRLDISRNLAALAPGKLDYFRLGPYVSWTGFDQNRSGFTRGHGGYFSPRNLWSVGLFTELLTTEGQQWQAKLSLNAGYNWITEAQASRFPLRQTRAKMPERVIEKNTSQGMAGQLTAQGQYQITPHWLVAGYLQRAHAVAYQSTRAGVEIRWHAGGVQGVTSDTLLLNDPAESGFVF
ncbi:cellulose synthase subunit BcsC-related outer membrane protein [Salinimonas chungwhensis]|uniref:cellulose synthase subunit BcsC-related outer membrane protein n=1 Tax=Salinimonas chungwhensis TaxID=265425 RepID=UPI00036E18BD|nr:cellulose synthase subunit BcsC-related outer membrane protein [Salinimonas chungwhensis]